MKILVIALSLLLSACASTSVIENLQSQLDATNGNVSNVNNRANAAYTKAEQAEANSLHTRNVVIGAFNNMNQKLDKIYAKKNKKAKVVKRDVRK